MTANAQSNPQSITFTTIQKVLDFKMYRSVKPKVIFSAYVSRVLPDNTSNIGTQTYSPVVQFKIDYDACCVGSMMALFTVDIGVRSTISEININGVSANGSQNGVKIAKDDIYSIQYAYCTDFIYHYVDKVSIGFANTGGNAPIWHQEIPSEIIKIYHTMLSTPGMSATIKRAIREDQFTIGHTCYGQYGDFSFAVKSPSTLPNNTSVSQINKKMQMSISQAVPTNLSQYNNYNELAVYWNDTEIKEVGFGNISNQGYNSTNSYQLAFKDPTSTGSIFSITNQQTSTANQKIIKKLDLSTELYWRLGTQNSTLKLSYTNRKGDITDTAFELGSSYMKIVSDEKYLLNDYQNYSKAVINTDNDDDFSETIYVVPYIKYSENDIAFNLAFVHAENLTYVKGAANGTFYIDGADANVKSAFQPSSTIKFSVIDSMTVDGIEKDYNGSISFTLKDMPFEKLQANDQAELITPIFIVKIPLSIEDDKFITGSPVGSIFGDTSSNADENRGDTLNN